MPGTDGEIAITSFTAAMLTQTFEGLIQALITQRERNAELFRESGLSQEEFIMEHISAEMARDELEARFGTATEGGKTRVDAGQPYVPPSPTEEEDPPVYKLCGVELREGDFERSRPSRLEEGKEVSPFAISAAGAQRIADAVVYQLASATLDRLRMLVRFGLPEIKVESGRILTKASFRIDSGTQNNYGTEQMLVRALNMSGPEGFKTRIGMSGEMELKFSVVRSESSGE